jgi:hypothetical protein
VLFGAESLLELFDYFGSDLCALHQLTTGVHDGFAKIGNAQVLPQENHHRRVVREFARRDLEVVVREEVGYVLAHGDEQLVGLGVEIVEFEGACVTILLFLDEDDVHKTDDAALGQMPKPGDDLARELGFLEFDQGIFQWKVKRGLTPSAVGGPVGADTAAIPGRLLV